MNSFIELEDGWSKILLGIENIINHLWPDDGTAPTLRKVENKEYMDIFTTVYNMCIQPPPHNYSEQLYQRYYHTIERVFAQNVQPHIDSAPDDELSMVIKDQKYRFHAFVKWIASFFSYLDRFHTKRQGLPRLREMGYGIFKDHLQKRFSEDIMDVLEVDDDPPTPSISSEVI